MGVVVIIVGIWLILKFIDMLCGETYRMFFRKKGLR